MTKRSERRRLFSETHDDTRSLRENTLRTHRSPEPRFSTHRSIAIFVRSRYLWFWPRYFHRRIRSGFGISSYRIRSTSPVWANTLSVHVATETCPVTRTRERYFNGPKVYGRFLGVDSRTTVYSRGSISLAFAFQKRHACKSAAERSVVGTPRRAPCASRRRLPSSSIDRARVRLSSRGVAASVSSNRASRRARGRGIRERPASSAGADTREKTANLLPRRARASPRARVLEPPRAAYRVREQRVKEHRSRREHVRDRVADVGARRVAENLARSPRSVERAMPRRPRARARVRGRPEREARLRKRRRDLHVP